ncbi:hypothetical protein [Thermotoga profunda]|uniref:hypothetical protein n=1 Tax=Thermotoga profunda TaxID=1508420 RepID=UPI001E5312AB|nr:hypothetical protein [Thermotoga profunda]
MRRLQIKKDNIIHLIGKLKSWSREDAQTFIDNLIGPLKRSLKERKLDLLQNGLLRFFEKGFPLIKKLENLSKEFSVPAFECLEIPFWVKPSFYPPPTDEMISLIKENDLILFIQNARKILKESMLKDFIELQAALMTTDESDMEWLASEINDITLQNCSEIESYKELYLDLNVVERAELISKLRCHAYVKAALIRKAKQGIVLDGNNIFMFRKRFSDLEFVLEKIAENDPFYYPFWIVFDKNIIHLVEEKDYSTWFESPSVFLYSPADELILRLAKEKDAVVVSSDRFRQWNTTIPRIDPRRFFE